MAHRSTIPLKPCIGMAVDSNHILIPCPKLVSPAHPRRQYHSIRCQRWTQERRHKNLGLGDEYVKLRRTRLHPPKPCLKGRTVRDGVIVRCNVLFTAKDRKQCYHSVDCKIQTRNLKKFGHQLGDSIRRTCAYRKCKDGEGGTNKSFDRVQRSPNGEYYCSKRHQIDEKTARRAEVLAKAKRLIALGSQRKRKAETETRPFEIGLKVEGKIPQDRKNDKKAIVVARQLISDETRLQYDVVAQYHKRFRATGLHPV